MLPELGKEMFPALVPPFWVSLPSHPFIASSAQTSRWKPWKLPFPLMIDLCCACPNFYAGKVIWFMMGHSGCMVTWIYQAAMRPSPEDFRSLSSWKGFRESPIILSKVLAKFVYTSTLICLCPETVSWWHCSWFGLDTWLHRLDMRNCFIFPASSAISKFPLSFTWKLDQLLWGDFSFNPSQMQLKEARSHIQRQLAQIFKFIRHTFCFLVMAGK